MGLGNLIRTTAFAAAILCLSTAGAVRAADLYLKAPPVSPPPGWAGTYVGISGGYGWGQSSQTDPGIPVPPQGGGGGAADGRYDVSGGLAGVTLGNNWQRDLLVLGVEGDFSWAAINGRSDICGTAPMLPHPCGTRLDALSTFRGRVGLAVGPGNNWLLYGTGGVAAGHLQAWDALTPASGDLWRAGWIAGAGIETMFAPNWSAKIEYLHVDLGKAPVFNIAPGVPESVEFTANIIRAGINYRFDGPAPQLRMKAPAVVAGGWSGWYAGVNGGYVDGVRTINTDGEIIANSDTPRTAVAMATGATSQISPDNRGFVGGFQLGFNRMLSPILFSGFEADIQRSFMHGSGAASTQVLTDTTAGPNTGSFVTNMTASHGLGYFGTVRGRLGAAVTPGMLLYVTGGLAYGSVTSDTNVVQRSAIFNVPTNTAFRSYSDVRAGYTVGAGGEWMFLPNWSLKAEYLYYDLGSANYGTGNFFVDEGPTQLPAFGVAGIATSTRLHFNGNIARVGINYHMN